MLSLHCQHARFVWNLALEQANWYDPAKGPTPNSAERMRQLTEARAASEWLAAGSTVVQQGALRDFDQALQNWWAGLRNGSRAYGRPTWRRRGLHEGFVVRDLSVRRVNRRWGEVLVPKVGWVRFRLTRAWHEIGACTSARVTLDRAGRWHAALTCPPPVFERTPTGAMVGVDRGVANSIATSDGEFSHVPVWTGSEQQRYLASQRQLARQKKDSNRRARTKAAIGKMHTKLGDRRKDWIEQTSTRLVRSYDVIAIENLNTRGMTRKPKAKPDPGQPGTFQPNGARAKAKLNKAILASCWGRFEVRLRHKAEQSGSAIVVAVDPRNTSRTCSACGHVAKENRESQAVFICQSCGHQAHADTNAAINIREKALAMVDGAGISPLIGAEVCGRATRERTHKPATRKGRSRVNHPPVLA